MPEKSGSTFHSLQFAKRPRRMVRDMSNDDKAAVEKLHSTYGRMKEELGRVIVGQEVVVEQALMAIFCRGHALLVGVPGLAKTLLVSTLSRALDLGYGNHCLLSEHPRFDFDQHVELAADITP